MRFKTRRPTRPIRVPGRLPDPPPGGVELARCPLVARACDVFTPEELEARIAAHRERVERDDPGPEPSRCWCCGVAAPVHGSGISNAGWFTRPLRLPHHTGRVPEMYCPECFLRWGWPKWTG